MKYALFTGCVIPIQTPFIEKLARDVFVKLDVGLVDLDFTCCPYYSVRDVDEQEWLVGAAYNLALAEKNGLDILTLCNGCSQTLIEANYALQDADELAKVNERLKKAGLQYNGKTKVLHFMMLLEQINDKVKETSLKSLDGLKVATHTGCHILRPSKILAYDDAENPKKFDELVALLGGMTVDYKTKTLCCGSSMITKYKDMSLAMLKEKIIDLQNKTDMLAVCCTSCFLQYDKNQVLLRMKKKLPVVHIIQLLAYSLGIDPLLENNRSGAKI